MVLNKFPFFCAEAVLSQKAEMQKERSLSPHNGNAQDARRAPNSRSHESMAGLLKGTVCRMGRPRGSTSTLRCCFPLSVGLILSVMPDWTNAAMPWI